MSDKFNDFINRVLKTAREYGYKGDMRQCASTLAFKLPFNDLTREQAEEIIDDETLNQGFSITTQQGEIIQPADVKLSKSVRIERYEEANSLLPHSAFAAVSEYFFELQQRNLTEQ